MAVFAFFNIFILFQKPSKLKSIRYLSFPVTRICGGGGGLSLARRIYIGAAVKQAGSVGE